MLNKICFWYGCPEKKLKNKIAKHFKKIIKKHGKEIVLALVTTLLSSLVAGDEDKPAKKKRKK